MKEKEFKTIKKLANERITEKEKELQALELIYKMEKYNFFNYTKKEIEEKMKELKKYIKIAKN